MHRASRGRNNSARKGTNEPPRTELFAALPRRAIGDNRLSARHFRVLAAVAYHDRFGRNGQGCWAGRKRLAAMAGCSLTHTSDALSDLRRFGYVVSQPHPMNRRTMVHRVIYDESNRSQIRDPLAEAPTADRSRLQVEQVPSQNSKSLNGNGNDLSNILGEAFIRDSGEPASRKSEGEKIDCAEARTSDGEVESTERYLSDVEEALSENQFSIRAEFQKLSVIADTASLPEPVRDRAAGLRDIAKL